MRSNASSRCAECSVDDARGRMRGGAHTESRQRFAGVDLDALLDDLADRIAARIGTNAPSQTSPRLLSIDDAATYIGRTRAAVDHMVRSGRLPVVRADRKIFLDVRDLDNWIDENKVQPDGI